MKIKSQLIERLQEEDIKSLSKLMMPVKISYFLSRAMSKLRSESESYFAQRKIILDRHKESESNGQVKIAPENLHAFMKEMKELQDTEIEIPIEKMDIKLDDLPDISVAQIEFIEHFFNIG